MRHIFELARRCKPEDSVLRANVGRRGAGQSLERLASISGVDGVRLDESAAQTIRC